jgi:uncharacterized membrane protein YgaE (UPF0421/DUF939 family)
MSENKYRIVRQSVTIEPVKPTLKERVIDVITTMLAIILGIAVALILALILNSCDH